MARLALLGLSFGASIAPSAAAYDHRFVAVIAIDGMYSMRADYEADVPAPLIALFKNHNVTNFDNAMNQARLDPTRSSQTRWLIDQSLWAFHTALSFNCFTQLRAYTLTPFLDKVTCPVFIGNGQDDPSVPGQAPVVAAALGDLATLYQFNNSLGAGQHCQLGAEPYLAQASLDWFQGIIDTK